MQFSAAVSDRRFIVRTACVSGRVNIDNPTCCDKLVLLRRFTRPLTQAVPTLSLKENIKDA